MSKKVTGSLSKLTSSSSYVPRLQTNLEQFEDQSSLFSLPDAPDIAGSRQKSAVRKSKLVKNTFKTSNRTNEDMKVHTDSSENDAVNGRPDVLSIDSDISSSNDFIDSPDQDVLQESSTLNKTLKQQNILSDTRFLQNLDPSSRESLKLISADYSYCTPPRILNEEKEQQRKKAEQYAFFSQNTAPDSERAPVSNAHRQRVPTVHGSSTNNAEHISSDRDRQVNVKVNPPCGSREKFRQAGEEVMDMKYTDLTHMQLKRSLDQIHGQNMRAAGISRSFPEPLYSGSQGYANAFYSLGTNENIQLPQSIGARIVGNSSDPMLNNYSEGAYYNNSVGLSAPHATKFDSIFQVKDAMLQEKEAVILKLRLQISSLQHQVQEGEAALRQTQKKIYDLEQLLGKAESKLVEKSSYFKSERKDLEEQVEKLKISLKTKELSHMDLSKKHKSTSERLDKYKKRVESLERYLGDLPTIEESNKLKTEAGLLGEERENLVVEMSTMKNKIEKKIKVIAEKEMVIKQLTTDKTDCMSRIKTLEEKLGKSEKSKRELGRTERDEFEDVRFEVARLQKEKDDAALMVSGCEKRLKQLQEKHKIETTKLKRQCEDADEMAEALRRESFLKQQASNKVHTAVMNLSSQNQQLLEEKLTLQDKVKSLDALHSNMRESSRVCYRLQRESAAALQDLRAVTQVLLQTAKGADPSISALLGVRQDSIGGDDDLIYQSACSSAEDGFETGLETTLSVENSNKRLLEVRKLRQDIDQLRTLLSNQYAESIGDNCVTQ